MIADPKYTQPLHPQSYACWDAIMHEYGHHVEFAMNIIDDDCTGGWHVAEINMTEHYSSNNHMSTCNGECLKATGGCAEGHEKECGIKMAWSEGWATVFGLIAQKYYLTYINSIAYVGDTVDTSYRNVELDLKNGVLAKGEACEATIEKVLWDFYDADSSAESFDTISIGATGFWSLTTACAPKTFSDVLSNMPGVSLSSESMRQKYAAILVEYRLSPYGFGLLNPWGVSETTAPYFGFYVQEVTEDYLLLNRFDLVFYMSSFSQTIPNIPITMVSNLYTYALPSAAWTALQQAWGEFFYVELRAYQVFQNSTTGPYYAALITFPNPFYTG